MLLISRDPLRPVVALQRIRAVIPCPGCVELFYVEDECAAHLLKSCIQFRSNDTSESRRNLVIWIVDYFKTQTNKEQNPPIAVKMLVSLLLLYDFVFTIGYPHENYIRRLYYY